MEKITQNLGLQSRYIWLAFVALHCLLWVLSQNYYPLQGKGDKHVKIKVLNYDVVCKTIMNIASF